MPLDDPRRMRRWRDPKGVDYDELPCGLICRRLPAGDPSPIPAPEVYAVVVKRVGGLRELTEAQMRVDRHPPRKTRYRRPETLRA